MQSVSFRTVSDNGKSGVGDTALQPSKCLDRDVNAFPIKQAPGIEKPWRSRPWWSRHNWRKIGNGHLRI